RIYQKQLLYALERDMVDQAALMRAVVAQDLRSGIPIGAPQHQTILVDAAERTRMRVRLLDPNGNVLCDSHRAGPPEGPEPSPARLFRSTVSRDDSVPFDVAASGASPGWPPIAERSEVRAALNGKDGAATRIAHREHAVFLFTATPVLGTSMDA